MCFLITVMELLSCFRMDGLGERTEWAGLAGQVPLQQLGCGTGWVQDVYWCPASPCCLITDISKLELESDLAADVARTSLTKPYRMLGLGVGATRRGACKALQMGWWCLGVTVSTGV